MIGGIERERRREGIRRKEYTESGGAKEKRANWEENWEDDNGTWNVEGK
jgi:hypothetical protein